MFSDELVRGRFFRTLVRVARTEAPEGEGAPETLFVNRPDAAPLMLSVQPLGRPELMVGGLLITIADPGERSFPDAELIAGYFGLSPAEALLCADLATGLSLREIAEKRHKSEATVRSCLKQVYLKTGYSRQGQLISGILASLLR